MYVYKSTAESSGITEQFRWQHKVALWPGGGKAPVSPCVPLCAIFLREPSVLAFVCESERGPFVREVEKRDEKRFGTALRRQFRRIFLSADSGGSQ